MKNFKDLNGIFVTGTDTGIGKTITSALLMLCLKGTYWKPVQTGRELGTDTQEVKRLTQLPEEHFLKEIYNLPFPLSPHLSAQKARVRIDLTKIKPPEVKHRPLIVEGAGGILVPLNEKEFILDLIKKLNFPVVLVSSTRLGTINHTLMSLYVLRKENINVLGVILNGQKNEDNRKAIEKYGKIKILAHIEKIPSVDKKSLESQILKMDV